jgi:hypothetical protein
MPPGKRRGPAITKPGPSRSVECITTDKVTVQERWLGSLLYSREPELGVRVIDWPTYDVSTLGITPHDRSRCPQCQAMGA